MILSLNNIHYLDIYSFIIATGKFMKLVHFSNKATLDCLFSFWVPYGQNFDHSTLVHVCTVCDLTIQSSNMTISSAGYSYIHINSSTDNLSYC